jgi:hypothetical protein
MSNRGTFWSKISIKIVMIRNSDCSTILVIKILLERKLEIVFNIYKKI